MSNEDFTPPRGDDAWQAARQDVAKRNEAAYAKGRKDRTARERADRSRRAAAERREFANLPRQPKPPRPAGG